MNLTVRKYNEYDIGEMTAIWNEVVSAADAFPQLDCLTDYESVNFFASQSYCGVCEDTETGKVVGGGTYGRLMERGVAFGAMFPDTPDTMHQANEYVPVDVLVKACAIYAEAIYELIK